MKLGICRIAVMVSPILNQPTGCPYQSRLAKMTNIYMDEKLAKMVKDANEILDRHPDPRQHEWVQWKIGSFLTVCKKCGIVKSQDGENKPCKGSVKATLR